MDALPRSISDSVSVSVSDFCDRFCFSGEIFGGDPSSLGEILGKDPKSPIKTEIHIVAGPLTSIQSVQSGPKK